MIAPFAARIAVVIPCYKAEKHILSVLQKIPDVADAIYVIDDKCPNGTADLVESRCDDNRVKVLRHTVNQGVGGAVMTGYAEALAAGFDVVVKIDGDGQMDPSLIPKFVGPILLGKADYTKGNRFYNPEDVADMPILRLLGNAGLSLLNKFSSGYWDIFDPTNGYTAIDRRALSVLPLKKISCRYFFETDMLFRLGLARAVVLDIPMKAVYGLERSNLRISSALPEFFVKHIRNFGKRVIYLYYLRDFSIASVELICGVLLGVFSVSYGGLHWWASAGKGVETPTGTIVLAAITLLASLQLLLSFVNFDIGAVPRHPLTGAAFRE